MTTMLTVLHVITCIFLMLTVLLQDGKSGGMGGAFGGGNAATVFGGSGASSFLRNLTAGASTMFMATSIVLAFLASHNSADSLEKFGENQSKLAADKEAAKQKALKEVKDAKGSGAGSGSAASGSGASGSGASIMMTPPAAGSAVTPALGSGNPGGGVTGTAPTPAERPLPAGATNEQPNPSTPAGMGEPKPRDARPSVTAPEIKPVTPPLGGPAKAEKPPEKAPAAPAPPAQ